MRRLLPLFLLLVCLGCATAPPKFEFNPVATIKGDYDKTWAAIVEYFAVGNLPIKTIEKDSGLIVSDWMDASDGTGMREDKTICDCGGAGLTIQKWTRGKFSVFAKKIDDSSCDMRVTCTYQQYRTFSDAGNTVNCNSNGNLEKMLHDYVRAKVEGTALPEVPNFRPGKTTE